MRAQISGCLLAGAIGDALGTQLMYMSQAEIQGRYGSLSATTTASCCIQWSSSTQLSLFTIEGLQRAESMDLEVLIPSLQAAYLRWLWTQGDEHPRLVLGSGGLLDLPLLYQRLLPDLVTLGALRNSQPLNTHANNYNPGYAAALRTAVLGLWAEISDRALFSSAIAVARLTHNHPNAYLPAAALAYLVNRLLQGQSLLEALACLEPLLLTQTDAQATYQAVRLAIRLHQSPHSTTAELLEQTFPDAGYSGHNALAIAIYALLSTHNLEQALLLAANHSGYSHASATMAGYLAGSLYGEAAIPSAWLESLTYSTLIRRYAAKVLDTHQLLMD